MSAPILSKKHSFNTSTIRQWLESTSDYSDEESLEDLLVESVRDLARVVGENPKKILEGIGPDRSKRVIFQDRSITFYLTADTAPDKFYRKKLVKEDIASTSVIVTNGDGYFVLQDGVPLDGGNFDWSSLNSKDQESALDLFSNVLNVGPTITIKPATYVKGKNLASKISQRLNRIVAAVNSRDNEEQVKKDFVFPLCRIAGWHVDPDDANDSKTMVEVERYQPHKGRLDLLLKDNGIPRIVIECKKPSVILLRNGILTEDGRRAIEQTHRYATGVRFWRHRRLPNIMSMVTNGKHAIWFDSTARTINDALKSAQMVEISKGSIGQVYQALNLQRVRETDLSYICGTRTIFDEKKIIETSATHVLAREVTNWLIQLKKSAKNVHKEDILAMTLQLLFLTVARDHGILGVEEIEDAVESSNWDSLFKKCHRRFNSNVFEKERPKALKPEVLNELYERTKTLPFSLEAIPVEYVGDIYESLLHNLHKDEKHLSKTSYFTPQWLVKEIVEEIKPQADEKVIDPTCGSAAFLCYTFDYVTKDMDFEEAREYLSTKIFGVDRDPLAVQVSRFALLVDLARKVNGDWREREHILPKLTNHIMPCDFFKFESKDRFDIALGNPPWGSIDKEVRDTKVKKDLQNFRSYKDKTDICIYVVEKAFNLLSKRGRLGFLVQRQTIDGVQHEKFRDWWNERIETVWDYKADELFAPRNKALTAVLLGRTSKAKAPTKTLDKSKNKSPQAALPLNLKISGNSFEEYFEVFQGGQAGCNDVYELFAEKKKSHGWVRSIASPEVIKHGVVSSGRTSLFIHPDKKDSEIPGEIKDWLSSNELEKKKRGQEDPIKKPCSWWLKNRAEVVRKSKEKAKKGKRNEYTFGWLWLNGSEHYKFDGKQSRIVFPYYLNGERLAAGLDKDGSKIPITSTTVMIPKETTSKDQLYFTLGWLNSKIFARTEATKGKLSAGSGRALYRDYIFKMLIPSVDSKTFNAVVALMKSCPKDGLSESDLSRLDTLFENALVSQGKKKAA